MNNHDYDNIKSLTVQELKALTEEKEEGKDFYLLDVRTKEEKKFSDQRVEGSKRCRLLQSRAYETP